MSNYEASESDSGHYGGIIHTQILSTRCASLELAALLDGYASGSWHKTWGYLELDLYVNALTSLSRT